MRVRFLLGPSGVGKTWRCLNEVRDALSASSSGAPLVFLTPRQATFQVERQLLSDDRLRGFTRLRILSFERLASWILTNTAGPQPRFLSGQGRIMVLRALLGRRARDLKVFHATAHSHSFAEQLGALFSELLQYQIAPESLARLQGSTNDPVMRAKLHDIALLLRAYAEWLAEQGMNDADALLPLATMALQESHAALRIDHLWFDGFAAVNPTEAALLAALAPSCGAMTFAFNIAGEESGWLSPWSMTRGSVERLKNLFAGLTGAEIETELLQPEVGLTRFCDSPALAHLERAWESRVPFSPPSSATTVAEHARLVCCPNREGEAIVAAREIIRAVRDRRGRYREIAILVRDLPAYHDVISRVFARYEIPCFIDRREPVSHHPFAELTRSALRCVAFEWEHHDWFGALKTGLASVDETALDQLENLALEHGWSGRVWLQPLPQAFNAFEALRKQVIAPFVRLSKRLGLVASGAALADALMEFWSALRVEETLENWANTRNEPIHTALWTQMQEWLDDVRLGFGSENLDIRAWIPIIESGLASQTVGLIPPALDQVLVGSIDRSRNPDLKVAIILGVNEGVFPSRPAARPLFTQWERDWMAESGTEMGLARHSELAREQFYGYIACTRARERVVLTFAERDSADATLRPSPFVARVADILGITVDREASETGLEDCESHADALRALLPNLAAGGALPERLKKHFTRVSADLLRWRELSQPPALNAAIAQALYGETLRVSVSALEAFGACPFRFFVLQGLAARERMVFKIDAREQGSFRHDVLAAFHDNVKEKNLEWRDLSPDEAAKLLGEVAAEIARNYGRGLLQQSAQARFEVAQITQSLQEFIRVVVDWMREHYMFSPAAVEMPFGRGQDSKFNCLIPLPNGRSLSLTGKIDRIDIARNGDEVCCVVIDYKSGGEQINNLLCSHGIQMQLLAYTRAIVDAPEAAELFGSRVEAGGFFYVALKTRLKPALHRREARNDVESQLRSQLCHSGRFDQTLLPLLAQKNQYEHIRYPFKDGAKQRRVNDSLSRQDFRRMLDETQNVITHFGQRIYAGDISISPYKFGRKNACGDCHFVPVCRFDSWTHPFRAIHSAAPDPEEEE